MSQPPLRVALISSIPPTPTSAGGLVLHRHLHDRPNLRCTYLGGEPAERRGAMPRLLARLGRTRLHRHVEDFRARRQGRWLDPLLAKTTENFDVVLTVAHGDACWAAQRFAQAHRRPLVTIFHDWLPDLATVHPPVHVELDRQFRELYRKSTVALSISEGMQAALGPHPRGIVLLPIPPAGLTPDASRATTRNATDPFRIQYFGNLIVYGPMLQAAIAASMNHPRLHLAVRGGDPAWPPAFRAEARQNGRWLDSAPRPELEAWLATADAFLIPMVFDPAMRQRMETSFPSKLTECAQYGKPIIVWGPTYSSAVRWTQAGQRACCVTSAEPHDLWRAVEALAGSNAEQSRLAAAARAAANDEFRPDRLQEKFESALRLAVTTS